MTYKLKKELLTFLISNEEKTEGFGLVVTTKAKLNGVNAVTLELTGGVTVAIPEKELCNKKTKIGDLVWFDLKTGDFTCVDRPKATKPTQAEKDAAAADKKSLNQRGTGSAFNKIQRV